MSKLHDLYAEYGQSPWLDNMRRDWLLNGEMQRRIDDGVRGITSNPAIFQKSISSDATYDEQFFRLMDEGVDVEDAYWQLVGTDISQALGLLSTVYDDSDRTDGFVSVEVAPNLAHDTEKTIAGAQELASAITAPNLMIKIPATIEGLPAITQMISEKRSINVTLIFGLERYEAVIDAYILGLEQAEGDLSGIASVASFFVSRVDAMVDPLLKDVASAEATALLGKAALAQARQAYAIFEAKFSSERWQRLLDRGAQPQRPLWASTSTKDPSYPETLYVDGLIGPNTVNTIPDATLDAFVAHGSLANTIKNDSPAETLERLASVGVDMNDVAARLEKAGVASFVAAYDDLLETLKVKADR